MSTCASRNRRTDYGTVILHWCLVVALTVAVLSGLRIASESPDRSWINALDLILPRRLVWTTHMQAAVALIPIAIAYPIYVSLARLWGRVRFDRIRLSGLFGRHQARWGAVNVALYWIFYLMLLSEIATGILVYFDYGNSTIITLHWLGMSFICGCTIAHVLVHWKIGKASQLLRIVRPARLLPQPPPFDPIDLLELLDQRASEPQESQVSRAMHLRPELYNDALQQFVPANDHFPLGRREPKQNLF